MLPKKILIIDDEKMIRLTTSTLLRKNGIEVVEASSGPAGLQLMEKEKPDLLLLDIMMPVMDGWEVLDKVRAMAGFSALRVVIFTAGDFIEAKKTAAEKKVRRILQKPYHLSELLDVISIKEEGDADA
jgi:CheY-like chemotaxis protein